MVLCSVGPLKLHRGFAEIAAAIQCVFTVQSQGRSFYCRAPTGQKMYFNYVRTLLKYFLCTVVSLFLPEDGAVSNHPSNHLRRLLEHRMSRHDDGGGV